MDYNDGFYYDIQSLNQKIICISGIQEPRNERITRILLK